MDKAKSITAAWCKFGAFEEENDQIAKMIEQNGQ